ncbi:MAG: hypothetical protein E6R05_07345, partial [Candidatus Moraniibacteriota bacterium]
MFKYLKNHKLLSFVVAIGLFGGVYLLTRHQKTEYIPHQVETGTIQDTLELSGKVNADSLATLRFPTGGLVTYLGPKEGETVNKWQTLATIDSRQLQKTLEQKLNLYSVQRDTFEQTIDDNDNSVPDGDLARTLS